MSINRTNLMVEELGTRTLPSSTISLLPGFTASQAIFQPASTQLAQPIHLHGLGAGIYTQNPTNPDTGLSTSLSGVVTTPGLGTFNVTGMLHGVGFVAPDVAHFVTI
ncbi:MAG: hypothetical protein K8U57_18015 [Planctomycetes bacterium]|nr:hypothetical protein [Planctomycetota bacterium]